MPGVLQSPGQHLEQREMFREEAELKTPLSLHSSHPLALAPLLGSVLAKHCDETRLGEHPAEPGEGGLWFRR